MDGKTIMASTVSALAVAVVLGIFTSFQGHADASDLTSLEESLVNRRGEMVLVQAKVDEKQDKRMDDHLKDYQKEAREQAAFRGAVMQALGIKDPSKQ